MRFAEAARAAPGEHLGATKGKAAVVELPHIHSLLRDVWKIDQDCVGFAGGAGDRKLSILKGPSPLFGREPSLLLRQAGPLASPRPLIRARRFSQAWKIAQLLSFHFSVRACRRRLPFERRSLIPRHVQRGLEAPSPGPGLDPVTGIRS